MKKSTRITIIFFAITSVAIIVAIYVGARTYLHRDRTELATSCTDQYRIHTVTIQNDHITPAHTDAKRCDQLKIINNDNQLRMIAFGQHDRHVAYDNISERRLASGQSFTITLNHTGSFRFHDHLHEATSGTFSVTK